MGKVSDYVSSLEGKDNIDPVVIASTMLELHNEEMGIATSKIASLEVNLTERDAKIAEKDLSIRDIKAANWDLVNRIPISNENDSRQNPAGNDNSNTPTMEEVLYGKDND
jgi:hypothetical protein